MPANKKPHIRYLMYDRCLMNKTRHWGFKELVDQVNKDLCDRGLEPIRKTTFYTDMKDMEIEFRAPIEKYNLHNRKYYRYSDPNYSFANQPLNQEEIDHIKDAVLILVRFSGLPGFEWIDDVVSKLELGTFEQVGDPNIIQFQSNEFLKGKEFIGPLFHAIIQKSVLEVKYQNFENGIEKEHLIHPYLLREYDDRWYILGYLPKHDDLITLCVDRINEFNMRSDLSYIPNDTYDFVDYFESLIGIRKDKDQSEERIVLQFSPLMSKYVIAKPIHGSQKKLNSEKDGTTTFCFDLIINNEFENKIFSFRDQVQVLEPTHLMQKCKETIVSMLGMYN